jgi:hypothetical protein
VVTAAAELRYELTRRDTSFSLCLLRLQFFQQFRLLLEMPSETETLPAVSFSAVMCASRAIMRLTASRLSSEVSSSKETGWELV